MAGSPRGTRFSWRSSSAVVLCPLPFSVIINDLEVNIKSPLIKFAADKEIGGVGDHDEDRAVMQSNLDCLVNWAHLNKVHFNTVKCKAVH